MRDRAALLLPVYLPTMLLAFGQGMLVPTLPLYAGTFVDSFSLISLVVTAAGIGTLVADVPAGAMLARIGRKRAMVIGTMGIAVATAAMGLASQFPELIVYRLIFGVGTALWNISRMAYLTDVTTLAERGRALSAFGGVSRIGTFVGPAVGGVVAAQWGLEMPFFIAAAIALAAAIIAIRTVEEGESRAPAGGRHLPWSTLARTARSHSRELITAGSAQIFVQMIRAGRQLIVPLYGANVLGLDVAQVGAIVSISAAIDMLLFIPAGVVMDRMGRKWATVPSFAVMAVGMALIPLTADFTTLALATGLIGLGNGMSSGTMMTLGADLAPRDAIGEFMGVWRLVGDAGSTGGPFIVGAIADAVGLGVAALALAGVGVVASVTLAVFVRETLRPPLRPGVA